MNCSTNQPSKPRKKYSVDKKINFLEDYCEVKYEPVDNFIIGRWLRIGTLSSENPSNKDILCKSCRDSFLLKLEKFNSLAQDLNDTNPSKKVSGERCYQVEGWTKPFVKYKFEHNECHNPNSCWGERKQIIEFQRRMKSEDGTQYRMRQLKVFDHERGNGTRVMNEKAVNTLYFTVMSKDRVSQWGIGIHTFKRDTPFFWPDLHKKLEDGEYFYYVEINRNNPPAPDLKDAKSWPSGYRHRSYRYVAIIDITYYRRTPGLPRPETREELENSHPRASLTCLHVYPGQMFCS